MARKTPPFKFVKRAAAYTDGKLKDGCRLIRTPSGMRALCPTRKPAKRRKKR